MVYFGEIIKIWKGGIVIYGGLIGVILIGYVFLRVKNILFWKFVDIVVLSILFGQVIGCWGNFMN